MRCFSRRKEITMERLKSNPTTKYYPTKLLPLRLEKWFNYQASLVHQMKSCSKIKILRARLKWGIYLEGIRISICPLPNSQKKITYQPFMLEILRRPTAKDKLHFRSIKLSKSKAIRTPKNVKRYPQIAPFLSTETTS